MSQVTGVNPELLADFPALQAPEQGATIRLHCPERTARLDQLFARYFTARPAPTLRVRVNQALKRLLDFAFGALGVLTLWPLILGAALATLGDTGLPVFYTQTRRIQFGRKARIWKMRTLVVGADRSLSALVSIKQNGRFLNIQKDVSSYTRIGRLLERLWIVEVPQFWCVLWGAMSVVGNRPIPDYVIEALGPTPDVLARFASPQGLTGYVQIIGRDNVTDAQRTALEAHYSRIYEHGNVFIEDLRITALTVLAYLGLGRERTVEDFLNSGAGL
jgi:exopolysaccharide production protein ExoY